MEEEKQAWQRELFEEFSQRAKGTSRFSWLKKSLSFRPLVFVISYEKLIFLSIGLLIILAIIFCIGIEQGKRIVSSSKEEILTTASSVGPSVAASSVPSSNLAQKEARVSKEETASNPDLKFIIQIASLKDKSAAEAEVSNLESKDYPAYWVTSGEYYVVCAGPFVNKKQTDAALLKLKKVYRTAYIRKR